jgi:hypothetical protein
MENPDLRNGHMFTLDNLVVSCQAREEQPFGLKKTSDRDGVFVRSLDGESEGRSQSMQGCRSPPVARRTALVKVNANAEFSEN